MAECNDWCCGGPGEPVKNEDVRATKKHRIKLELSVQAVDADHAVATVMEGWGRGITLEYIEAGVAEEDADW